MRRKHQRARDSFVNEEEDFKQLSGWRKAKLIVQNPLAFLKSKTKRAARRPPNATPRPRRTVRCWSSS